MAYTPQQWHDDTTSDPYGPISGDRLNYIEAGIQAAAAAADAAGTASGGTATPLGTAAPIIDGAAAAGTSGSAAHEDHVHPTDTSRAALASPTFTGHPVGVTEAALNNSTRLATTAYTDTAVGVETTRATTAEGLLAPLASPTFSGTPSLPTASVGVTQSAADSTTKLATTAFVTTADNLKANLASPTFTGTATVPNIAGPTVFTGTATVPNIAGPTVFTGTATIPNIAGPTTLTGTVTLPSTTVAVTPSASDNSTKPATTAYVDTADALKANLASPTFSGTPSLPTATTGVTQTAGDNSTKLATTAYADRITTGSFRIGVNTYANFYPILASAQASQQNAGDARYVRVVIDQTGTLHDVYFYLVTGNAGNGKVFVLDTGQANGTHTTCTIPTGGHSGNLSFASTGWVGFDPALAVTKGDTYYLCITNPDTTSKMATNGTIIAAGLSLLPNSSFLPSSGAGTTSQKVSGNILSANVPAAAAATVTDANMANSPAGCPLVVWRVT